MTQRVVARLLLVGVAAASSAVSVMLLRAAGKALWVVGLIVLMGGFVIGQRALQSTRLSIRNPTRVATVIALGAPALLLLPLGGLVAVSCLATGAAVAAALCVNLR